ncbi:helix-turn-helix domain-containing protein [Treponema sp.]|uniref:helix-turn-helix domain-containing protein n=1 Tax=Treponema sp. TaxID=166 RepID=UPI003EFEFADE
MRTVFFFDKSRAKAEKLMKFSFWKKASGFELDSAILLNSDALREKLSGRKNDVLIAFSDGADIFSPECFPETKKYFPQMLIIVIGKDGTYSAARTYFISGVFDYLIYPFEESVLEQAVYRIYEAQGEDYISVLKLKADALIDNIFLGGGQEKFIIREIFDQIYRDWNNDHVNCQIVSEKAKSYIYETLVERKPWLEKFLYKPDFYHHSGFSLKNRDELINQWVINFRDASVMVKKYQMIDDKLVYRIGKYVVVHVDERLSLDDVSAGVFLNPSYISHIFKKVVGMSFVNFMTEVKIDRAKVLLKNPDTRINEVAYTLGYSNQEYFTRTFKKKTSLTPLEYQKMLIARGWNIH